MTQWVGLELEIDLWCSTYRIFLTAWCWCMFVLYWGRGLFMESGEVVKR